MFGIGNYSYMGNYYPYYGGMGYNNYAMTSASQQQPAIFAQTSHHRGSSSNKKEDGEVAKVISLGGLAIIACALALRGKISISKITKAAKNANAGEEIVKTGLLGKIKNWSSTIKLSKAEKKAAKAAAKQAKIDAKAAAKMEVAEAAKAKAAAQTTKGAKMAEAVTHAEKTANEMSGHIAEVIVKEEKLVSKISKAEKGAQKKVEEGASNATFENVISKENTKPVQKDVEIVSVKPYKQLTEKDKLYYKIGKFYNSEIGKNKRNRMPFFAEVPKEKIINFNPKESVHDGMTVQWKDLVKENKVMKSTKQIEIKPDDGKTITWIPKDPINDGKTIYLKDLLTK